MLYLFVHTTIVSQWILYVNTDLCICGKVWRVDLSIYTFSPLPRLWGTPPAAIPWHTILSMPSISSPHAPYATRSVIYGAVLMHTITLDHTGLYWLMVIYLYYTIILYVFQ